MLNNLLTLEINENKIKFVRAGLVEKQIEVDILGEVVSDNYFYENDLPKTISNEAKIIDDFYNKLKLKEKNINIVLSDAYCFTQITTMPKLKEKELLSAIRYQADQFIPMPLSETALDLEVIYEDKKKNQILVMIVASPQTLIKKVSDLSDQLGLITEVIENQTSAVSRLLSTVYEPVKKTGYSIFVNFNYKTTTFYLYSHELGLIVDLHSIRLGYEIFLKEIQINLQTNYEKNAELLKTIGFANDGSVNIANIIDPTIKEMVGELEKYVVFAKDKFRINELNQVLLFNDANSIRFIDKKIEASLSMPTAIFDLKEKINLSATAISYQKDLSLYISTIGGCLR